MVTPFIRVNEESMLEISQSRYNRCLLNFAEYLIM